MKSFDIAQELPANIYKMLIGSVVPRPIAWVSTISKDGVANLAPFSYFTIGSINPPILIFAPQNARTEDGGARRKDTLVNVHETGECVIHLVPFALKDAMNLTAAPFLPEISEFDGANITQTPSVKVKPPRVEDAPIAFECVVDQIVSFGDHAQAGNVVCARIVYAHFAEEVFRDYKINIERFDPISRLGGAAYGRTKTDTFDLPRPEDLPR